MLRSCTSAQPHRCPVNGSRSPSADHPSTASGVVVVGTQAPATQFGRRRPGPSRCRSTTRTAKSGRAENVAPPPVLLGSVDADVIGHDVDDQAHPARPRRSRQPCQPFGAAERRRHGGGIGDVVAVGGALDRGQDRRQVQMRHPEVVEVVQHVQGVGEGEAVTAHLQPIRRQHADAMRQAVLRSTSSDRACSEIFSPASTTSSVAPGRVGGVERGGPLLGVAVVRSDEVLRLVVRVEAQQERVVDHPLAALVGGRDRVAVEEHRHALVEARYPSPRASFPCLPGSARRCRGPGRRCGSACPRRTGACGTPGGPCRNWTTLRVNVEQVGVLLAQRPVHPRDLGVLAVDVVVAALGAADLVAVRDHRRALRHHQRAHDVAHLLGRAARGCPDRRSGPPPRSSTTGCGFRRRGCPRRWPRCASRCRTPGRQR